MAGRQNYYDLLGVMPHATDAEIRRAYRQLALKLHPDHNPAPDANERFKALNDAYHTLIDPAKRLIYDLRRAQRTQASPPRTNPRSEQASRPLQHEPSSSLNPNWIIWLLYLGIGRMVCAGSVNWDETSDTLVSLIPTVQLSGDVIVALGVTTFIVILIAALVTIRRLWRTL